ncbi:MAG: hypothetical protein KatS3mg061_3182 [Dehalococcoidia bacterium]|nr:MAG: hypothetical protein KatS3mg061_3182 [Dehalococcoidia bacterium]
MNDPDRSDHPPAPGTGEPDRPELPASSPASATPAEAAFRRAEQRGPLGEESPLAPGERRGPLWDPVSGPSQAAPLEPPEEEAPGAPAEAREQGSPPPPETSLGTPPVVEPSAAPAARPTEAPAAAAGAPPATEAPPPAAAPVASAPPLVGAGKDPSTAFLLELLLGLFGFLGIGYLYAGRTNEGLFRLVVFLIYNLVAWTTILVLSFVVVGICLIPFQLAVQVGVPIWSALRLRRELEPAAG